MRLFNTYYLQMKWEMNDGFNPTLHGGGHYDPPPSNFGASQLQQEGLVWSNLHGNLVTWVPTVTKTQKKFQNFNGVCTTQVVTK